MDLTLKQIVVEDIKNFLDVKNSLVSLADYDADMNGDNGTEYLWDEVPNDDSYNSNAEWLADKVMHETDDIKSMFEFFMYQWMSKDRNYYSGYEIDFVEMDNKLIVAIAYNHEN